jgi:hypothetical protein
MYPPDDRPPDQIDADQVDHDALALDCATAAGLLDLFAEELLRGVSAAYHEAVRAHLVTCPLCGRAYVDLLDFSLGEDVASLRETLRLHDEAPPDRRLLDRLDGLLSLFQLQVEIGVRLADAEISAYALSVIGMLRRQLGELGEARLVHQLALQTADRVDAMLSQVISHTDLAYLESRRGADRVALAHAEQASRLADELGDDHARDRLRFVKRTALRASRERVRRGLQTAGVGIVPRRVIAGPSTIYVLNLRQSIGGAITSTPLLAVDDDDNLTVTVTLHLETQSLPTDRTVYLEILFTELDDPLVALPIPTSAWLLLRDHKGQPLSGEVLLDRLARADLAARVRAGFQLPPNELRYRIYWPEQ